MFNVWNVCTFGTAYARKRQWKKKKREKNYYNLAHCSHIWFHYVCLFSETSVTLTIANAVHAQGEIKRYTSEALFFLLFSWFFFCSSNFISSRCRVESSQAKPSSFISMESIFFLLYVHHHVNTFCYWFLPLGLFQRKDVYRIFRRPGPVGDVFAFVWFAFHFS